MKIEIRIDDKSIYRGYCEDEHFGSNVVYNTINSFLTQYYPELTICATSRIRLLDHLIMHR